MPRFTLHYFRCDPVERLVFTETLEAKDLDAALEVGEEGLRALVARKEEIYFLAVNQVALRFRIRASQEGSRLVDPVKDRYVNVVIEGDIILQGEDGELATPVPFVNLPSSESLIK